MRNNVPCEDYNKIINFLVTNWNENHILVKSKELLDFQHYDKVNNVYNFVVAENKETGAYDGLFGYIPLAHFDPDLAQYGDYWGAIWKRNEKTEGTEMIGVALFLQLRHLPDLKTINGLGLSGDALRWYAAMRWPVLYMHQYYILNRYCSDFKIAAGVKKEHFFDCSQIRDRSWRLCRVSFEDIANDIIPSIYRPFKSLKFIENRYFRHPFFKYDYLGLYKQNDIKALLVTRTIEVNNSKVLRIVDVLGELGGYVYPDMQRILSKEGCEYVDFLNEGIEPQVFCNMGFSDLDYEGELVLPNYFEPFEQRNIRLAAVHTPKFECVTFKADADQDRPNSLKSIIK